MDEQPRAVWKTKKSVKNENATLPERRAATKEDVRAAEHACPKNS